MLLAEGIRNSSTIDKREMNIFFNERRFWRNVLERLIDIALFLSERNLAFRGSEEVLGSPHNGNFLGIFELLARRDPILKELQDRIKNKNTKDHYLSPTIQNELIELLATEVEKENLQQLKLAKYFSIILAALQICHIMNKCLSFSVMYYVMKKLLLLKKHFLAT